MIMSQMKNYSNCNGERIINYHSDQDVKSAKVISKVKNKEVIEGSYKNLPELQG